jgi:hypothetical protein
VRVSETEEVDDAALARFVAMGAYGEVMLRFQPWRSATGAS